MNAAEFYSDTPRIMGTEMEHNNTVQRGEYYHGVADPLKCIYPFIAEDVDVPHLADPETYDYYRRPTFLPTGDRLYMDVGNHTEFSTAEFTTAAGVVGREFTGGNLLFSGMARALENDAINGYRLYKNVSGDGNYWGYHENYLGLRRLDIVQDYAPPMVTHLVTRQIFAGAGDITQKGEFSVSQKMPAAREVLIGSACSPHKRPILDVGREEPHAHEDQWRRIHVAIGDPHLNPRAAWLQLITTSIVTRLPEAGIRTDDLKINDPVKEAKMVSTDISLEHELEVGGANAKKLTALQIQKELHARAVALNDRSPLPPEEQLGLEVWGTVLEALEQADDLMLDWVEWIDKRELLVQTMKRKGFSWGDKAMRAVNREWANLDPAKGYGLRRAFRSSTPPDVMVGYGDLTPPDGRPALRAAFIRNMIAAEMQHRPTNFTFSINWQGGGYRYLHPHGPRTNHVWGDPYGEEERISQEVIKSMAFNLGNE